MCGIAGIISPIQPAEHAGRDHRDIKTMADQLAHRGPDGEGFWQNPSGNIYFGHRRLAVIDTTPAAAQPMHYLGRYTIIYNGELYNYLELRHSLQQLGHQFHTGSDTEVILAAFDQYKEECLGYFDGMFAFAIWDEHQQRLFLARDRFGEKPMFIHEDVDGRFLFASEMKAFWAIGVPRNLDDNHNLLFLATGLTSFPLAPEQTFFTNIFQLPAASYMWVGVQREEIEPGTATRYWDLDTRREYEGNIEKAAEELRARLRGSVQMRLRADVAVGTSLSGGVDSSSIAALISQEKGKMAKAFSAVFPGFEKDESENIHTICQALSLDGLETRPSVGDLLSCFDRLLWHQEEPIGSASVLVQYKVFELARQAGVTVLLDGQGADEILGGYPQYIPWYLQEKWRSGRWQEQRQALARFRGHGHKLNWGIRNYAAAVFPQAAQGQLLKKQKATIGFMPMLNPDYAASFNADAFLYKPLVTHLNDLLYFDTTMGKLPELLRYADRNSMAHSREVRLPYLQHELVQWVYSLPSDFKMKDGHTKWILRKSLEDLIPSSIGWQTRKIAFEPPQDQWMQDQGVQERIHASREKLVQKGILHKKILNTPVHAGAANSGKNFDWRYWVLGDLCSSR